MPETINITWESIFEDVDSLAKQIKNIDAIVGIGRGGLIPATLLSYKLNIKCFNNFQLQSYSDQNKPMASVLYQIPSNEFIKEQQHKNVLIVDDLSDRGKTLEIVKNFFESSNITLTFATLYIKNNTSFVPDYFTRIYKDDEWIVFPWE